MFRRSVIDRELMPPTCCTNHHIPLKTVEILFDTAFKKTWNKKNTTSAAESSGNVLAVRQKYAYFVGRNGMGQETALKTRIPKCFLQ
jgi:hypothetical protein